MLFKPICFRAAAMDNQQVPLAAGSPASSTSSWHSAFDPPSETISPKHDKNRSKDVGSKKSKKKKKKKKKSTTTSSNQRRLRPISMIQFLTFFAKAKQTAPRPRWTLSNMRVVAWLR